MSAAEKLEALDDFLPLYSNRTEPKVWKLRAALPEIIAVVEAAETFSQSTNGRRQSAIRVALSDLDEALPQIGSTPPPEGATSP